MTMAVSAPQVPTGLAGLFTTPWHHRALLRRLVRREIESRYRGSLLGVVWALLTPILMLAVFTFVFSVVFQARWGGSTGGKGEFALILFAGLIVFNMFSEALNRSPSLVLENPSYVKKVVFPLEVLPWVMVLSSLFQVAISLGILLLFHLAVIGLPPLSVLFLPLVWLPLLLLCLGTGFLFGALGVYLRDLRSITPVASQLLMFLSPLFYPASALPESFRGLLHLNPLTGIIENTRTVLFAGTPPDWTMLGVQILAGLLFAALSLRLFRHLRTGFADIV
ncbi:lipopolysaccharide transport system permease protein [Azospirillum brasilense]|nr:lipopolysaccharide transport system permease protein [Azospirillum brasilense]